VPVSDALPLLPATPSTLLLEFELRTSATLAFPWSPSRCRWVARARPSGQAVHHHGAHDTHAQRPARLTPSQVKRHEKRRNSAWFPSS